MRNIIKLFVIVILFNGIFLINQTSYAQTYGLEFKGQNVPLEERTGLDLTPNKLLKFKDEFEISFLAKGIQTKSELDLTGCVLQITGSNNNTINLLSILTPPEGLYIFLEKLNKSIPIAGSNESIYEWKKFTIKFLLKEDKLIFSYADSIYVQENVGFKRKDSFKIIFGLNNNSEVRIKEVPPMAIKESVRVPFLISYPNMIEKGGIDNKTPITTPDILPTLLSMCNIMVPETVEGEDLSKVFLNPKKEKDRPALISHPCPFSGTWEYPGYRAIRTMQYSYVKSKDGAFMLFDNISDPLQLSNLINKPELSDIQNRLDNLLHVKLNEVGDKEIRDRQYYLDQFDLNPNGGRYTYKYIDVKEADSPQND